MAFAFYQVSIPRSLPFLLNHHVYYINRLTIISFLHFVFWCVHLNFFLLMATVYQVYTVIMWIFVVLSLISNLLSLQTFLCTKKIRVTNCGIYLISFSIICIVINLVLPLQALPISEPSFQIAVCVLWNFIMIPSISVLQWLNGFVAIERVLIECYDFSLYDPRRRSIISTGLLLLIQIIWNSFPNIFCRQVGITINSCDGQLTHLGNILLAFFFYKELIPFVLFIVAIVLVLRQLARHRSTIIGRKLTFIDYFRICSNHRDFFTPLVLYSISVIPTFIYYAIHPYYVLLTSKEDYIKLLIFESIYHFSTTLTFVTYVYANRVYKEAFWNSSLVGRGLINLRLLVCKNN